MATCFGRAHEHMYDNHESPRHWCIEILLWGSVRVSPATGETYSYEGKKFKSVCHANFSAEAQELV